MLADSLMLPEYQFNSRYLNVNGHRMHYLDEGDGETVVLVHGNPTWSYYYRNLAKLLSKRFRVVVPDHIGCGLSDKPASYDYTLKNHIDNLSVLLTQLGIRKTSLVVHDWGGAIGLGAAALHNLEVEKLVVLNTAAYRSKRIPFRISICRWPLLGDLLVKGLNGFAAAATFMAVSRPMEKEIAAAYVRPYSSWRNRIAVHEFVKDIPLKPMHRSYQTLVDIERYVDGLAENPPPMTILWGGKDFCFNDHFYDEWTRRFPGAEHCYFDNFGHYILEDGRGQVEPMIDEFLGKRQEG